MALQTVLLVEFLLIRDRKQSVRLSDYKGKRVIVNFWATWCPPCRAEIPDLQKLYNNKDVVILAVNLTETEKVKKRSPNSWKNLG